MHASAMGHHIAKCPMGRSARSRLGQAQPSSTSCAFCSVTWASLEDDCPVPCEPPSLLFDGGVPAGD